MLRPGLPSTRPLGASFADGFSKPAGGGLGLGDGTVSLIALVVFIGVVAWVTVTKRDVQRPVSGALTSPPPPPSASPGGGCARTVGRLGTSLSARGVLSTAAAALPISRS